MNDLERLPGKKDKWADFQDRYNTASKNIVSVIGANMALFVCILLPVLLVGFIWTDFGAPTIGVHLLSDGVVTVALFIIGELMMMRVGADGGKLDKEYIAARKEFKDLVEKINGIGTMFMSMFCEWQIDLEMEQAVNARLKALRFTKADWDKVKSLSYSDLVKMYGRKKARSICALNRLEPVELNEAILMYDGVDENLARGGVPISAEGYMHSKTHSIGMILGTVFASLMTVSVAITLTSDISFSRVMYTAFKLIILLFRMAKGYETGASAYNTVEVRQLKSKSSYLRQYERFVNEKTYQKLGDKYGDIECYLSEAEPTTND